MQTPIKHNVIKQAISIAFIWSAFQATPLSFYLSKITGVDSFKNLLTVSIFLMLYKAVNFVYDKYLWRLFYREQVIDGRWVYALCGLQAKRMIYGTFTIQQTVDSLDIYDGRAWYADDISAEHDERRGDWQGKVIDWSANQVTILFHLVTLALSRENDRFGEKLDGLIIVSYSRVPIMEMQGLFNGIGVQSERRGPLLMQKVRHDTPEEIRKIGYELSRRVKPMNSNSGLDEAS